MSESGKMFVSRIMEARRESYDRRNIRRLYRSRKDAVLAGVTGGVGEHLRIDSGFLRLCGVVLLLLTGLVPGLIAYVVAALLIPLDRDRRSEA